MTILRVIGTSAGSFFLLFLLTKLDGRRQMSELSMFDYITGITIGSIASEAAVSGILGEVDFLLAALSMVIYAFLTLLFSFVTSKSIFFRKVITGTPWILFHKGEFLYENLRRARLDVNEFLSQCRINGYFDLSQIETAILEPVGKISFLPAPGSRPLTGDDLLMNLPGEGLAADVILDGKVMTHNLRFMGKDEKWLEKELSSRKINPKKVLLATLDQKDNLELYLKEPRRSALKGDPF